MGGLRRRDLDPDPIRQFAAWLDEARRAGLPDPHACALATASHGGAPSARMVLLKRFDERGFVFATHYGSRKSSELRANPAASLLFFWQPLQRQVRIEGAARPTTAAESDELFDERPLEARIGAIASPQSRVLADRQELRSRFDRVRADARGAAPARPESWGGYRLVAQRFEFWLGRRHRLHDRLMYRREAGGTWTIERLAP